MNLNLKPMMKTYRKLAIISLLLVYLVIAAGSIVRMTGSGMGCPDWPKCFGYYIPPTERAELEWKPSREYKKGQVIIRGEQLLVASADFQSGSDFQASYWEAYTKHDYAEFNVYHTWTEFINRLLGALAGLAVLITALVSLAFRKENKKILIVSWLAVIGMGFQAWLGATVVYSVLEPLKISMHMIMALIIVALLIYLVYASSEKSKTTVSSKLITRLITLALALTLIQIILGLQVRQFVDDQIDLLGEQAKALWLKSPEWGFYVHRSFSALVVLLNGYIAYLVYKGGLDLRKIYWVLVIIGLEVISGIAMYYVDFPLGSQPLHLLLAAILFGLQFHLFLETRQKNYSS